MAQRKQKQSRQAEARRRWHDLHDANRAKYRDPWKRQDRRRQAFQAMKQRLRIVQHYRQGRMAGLPEGEAAHQTGAGFGYSVSSVRNYYRLWRDTGKRGLIPAFPVRGPRRGRTPWEVIQLIFLFRRLLHGGGDRIAAELKSRGLYQISGQGVDNLFRRYRVSTRTDQPVGQRKGIAYRQGEVNAVNDVWHLDFAGPFVTPTGRKCWVLLVVEAYSRLLLTLTVVEALETQTVCDHLTALFADYETPKMIVTDNATTFTSVWTEGEHLFTEFLNALGIQHHRIPPYYPEANGKAEAAVKLVKREALQPFFKAVPDWNPGQLQRLLTRFQTYYNCHRLHGGIGWQTPAQRWFTNGDKPPKKLDHLFFIYEPELHFSFC